MGKAVVVRAGTEVEYRVGIDRENCNHHRTAFGI